jgi:hypothetical protein
MTRVVRPDGSGRRVNRKAVGVVVLLVAAALLLVALAGVSGGQRPTAGTSGSPATAAPATPATAGTSGTPATANATFIAFGDPGSGSSDELALRDRMVTNASSYDFAVMTGDGAYPSGSNDDYKAHFFAVYAKLFQGYATALPAPTSATPKPVYPTLGNHDYDTTDAAGYRAAFVLPSGGPAGAPAESYYTFDVGGVHFVSFDSHYVVGYNMSTTQAEKDAVGKWLISDLDANTSKVTVVFEHDPAYTAGDHHGQVEERTMRSTWFPIFAAHGVDLVLSGHDHGYERNTPQAGLTSYVTGGGGGALYAFTTQSYTAASMSSYHYLQISITGCTISTVAIKTDGSKFDPWSYTAPTCNTGT